MKSIHGRGDGTDKDIEKHWAEKTKHMASGHLIPGAWSSERSSGLLQLSKQSFLYWKPHDFQYQQADNRNASSINKVLHITNELDAILGDNCLLL